MYAPRLFWKDGRAGRSILLNGLLLVAIPPLVSLFAPDLVEGDCELRTIRLPSGATAIALEMSAGSKGQSRRDRAIERPGQDGPRFKKQIDRIIGAANALEASRGFEALFAEATAAELKELKFHQHLSIALTAAWEELRRTFPRRGQERIRVDTRRFVGYVEGRLGFPVPETWDRALAAAEAVSPTYYIFKQPEGAAYDATDLGVLVAPGISLTRRGTAVALKSGDISVSVPERVLRSFQRGGGPMISVDLSPGDGYFVVHYLGHKDASAVYRIDARSGKVLWMAEGWGSGLETLLGAPPLGYHCVSLVRKKDLIVVFGVARDCVYVEGFSASDGSNVFRFNGGYALPFPEE